MSDFKMRFKDRSYGYMDHTNDGIFVRNIPNQQVGGYAIGIVYIENVSYPFLPGLAIGTDGGFAILMNALPKEYVHLYQLVKDGKWDEAREYNMSMASLYTAMEAEPYPGPVKTMMRILGVPGGYVRKPLVQTSKELTESMTEELRKLGKIK
ncbi:MAG: dihydrodipicolinate synthase family protein [Eubacteriales bacterium]|nr:dihydrodipicolinate synthase family protein [Eubacteriales bacterium]